MYIVFIFFLLQSFTPNAPIDPNYDLFCICYVNLFIHPITIYDNLKMTGTNMLYLKFGFV